jgi:hypothetical protein
VRGQTIKPLPVRGPLGNIAIISSLSTGDPVAAWINA